MYSASLELDYYLGEEPVRRYVVTVPVAPLVQRSAVNLLLNVSAMYVADKVLFSVGWCSMEGVVEMVKA